MRKRKVKKKKPVRFPLRELLLQHGWSQRKLASASGIAQNRVSDLYHGRREPKWSTVLKIMTTIGADLGDLGATRPATSSPGGEL